MPVSPQDFALWSDMTGNPYPQTPAERMALAPEVYNYTRNIGRQRGPTMGPVRRAVDIAGKAALLAGGIAGAAYLLDKFPPSPPPGGGGAVGLGKMLGGEGIPGGAGPSGGGGGAPGMGGVPSGGGMPGGGGAPTSFGRLDLDNEPAVGSTVSEAMPSMASRVSQVSGDVTPPTTSDYYNQDVVPHQTSVAQSLRGTTSQKPTLGVIEQKPATQSEVISSQHHFTPGSEEQQLASSAQPSPTVRGRAEELIGRVSATQVEKFRQSPSYLAAVKSSEPEELIGDDTPFVEPARRPIMVAGTVRPTPQTRIISKQAEESESPIAAMAAPAAVRVGSEELAPAAVATVAPRRQTAEQMEDERLARLAFGNMPLEQATALLASARAAKGSPTVTATTPSAAPEVKQKLFQKAAVRPSATTPGTEEHLIAQAREHLEAVKPSVPAGAVSHEIGGSSTVKNITMYPGNQISVTYGSDPDTQYAFKADPRYARELQSMLQEGQFGPGGMHSAGGFIQAGINKKLLY